MSERYVVELDGARTDFEHETQQAATKSGHEHVIRGEFDSFRVFPVGSDVPVYEWARPEAPE